MVPVSIRAEAERGALGNKVAAIYAPLPVGLDDPRERLKTIHEALSHLKQSGQAVGAERITQLAGFAVPTVLNQAARLQSRQRFFNLTVTNVPGPQFPLYMLGRKLNAFYPMVPVVLNTALGIAIMSYDGKIFFGLLGDYDAMEDLDQFAADLSSALDELSGAAGVPPSNGRRSGRARPAARRTQSRA
jgi:WS/DGAT/MGAT family acyltransferase